MVVADGKTRVRGAKVPEELLAQLKANKAGVMAEWERRQALALDRYGTVPSGEVQMAGRDLRWRPGEADAVMGYVLRQPHPVHAWMQARANAYHVLGAPLEECERCACADLLAWQRNADGTAAVEWLMGIEGSMATLPGKNSGNKNQPTAVADAPPQPTEKT